MKRSWNTLNSDAKGQRDKLYWLNGNVYERLDASSWSNIETGRAKL